MTQKGLPRFTRVEAGLAPILIVVVITLAIGGYFIYNSYSKPKQIACTKEAKICPDGSSVGRVGPKCEFSLCPSSESTSSTSEETANWKTYTSADFTFKYPSDSDWTLYRGSNQPGTDYLVRVACWNCRSEYTVVGFSIKKTPYKSNSEYITNTKGDYDKNMSDSRSYKLNGVDAIEALIQPNHGNGISTLEFFVLGKGYLLTYEILTPGNGKLENIHSPNPNILSTLKFTQ